jgi:hypothetical protein
MELFKLFLEFVEALFFRQAFDEFLARRRFALRQTAGVLVLAQEPDDLLQAVLHALPILVRVSHD